MIFGEDAIGVFVDARGLRYIGKENVFSFIATWFAAYMLHVCALPHAPVCIRSSKRALALPRPHGAPSEHIRSLDSSRKNVKPRRNSRARQRCGCTKQQASVTLTLEPKLLKGLLSAAPSGDERLKWWPQVPAASPR